MHFTNTRFLGIKCQTSFFDGCTWYFFGNWYTSNRVLVTTVDNKTFYIDRVQYIDLDELKAAVKAVLDAPYIEYCSCRSMARVGEYCSWCEHTHTDTIYGSCGCPTNQYRKNKLHSTYDQETNSWIKEK